MDDEILYCKKLVFKVFNSSQKVTERVLYGFVRKDDGEFIKFQTGKGVHEIAKSTVLRIEPTDRIFKEEKHDHRKV